MKACGYKWLLWLCVAVYCVMHIITCIVYYFVQILCLTRYSSQQIFPIAEAENKSEFVQRKSECISFGFSTTRHNLLCLSYFKMGRIVHDVTKRYMPAYHWAEWYDNLLLARIKSIDICRGMSSARSRFNTVVIFNDYAELNLLNFYVQILVQCQIIIQK